VFVAQKHERHQDRIKKIDCGNFLRACLMGRPNGCVSSRFANL